MSEVLKKMETRRSIRKYKKDAVPQEILDQILEAGLYAASGRGTAEHHYDPGYRSKDAGRDRSEKL